MRPTLTLKVKATNMALIQTRVCDRCQAREDTSQVMQWKGVRGQSRVQGDLCSNCWSDLVSTFKPAPQSRGRHRIVVVD